MTQISLLARECLQDSCSTIKVNAIKVLQELGRVMYQTLSTNKEESVKEESLREEGKGEESLMEESLRTTICEFWLKLLEGDIVTILQSKDPLEGKTKSAACDCLSDIGSGIFEELTFDKRILIVTVLLGLLNDEDSYVRVYQNLF